MRILIIQPDCRDYRIPFFLELNKSIGDFTLLHFGTKKFSKTQGIKEIIGTSWSFFGFYWISHLRLYIHDYDFIIFGNDFHWLNIFFAPIFYKKKMIAWGHGLGNSNIINYLKLFQSKFLTALIVYSEKGKEDLSNFGFSSRHIFVAPNTIYVENSLDTSSSPKDSFLFVGRLQRRKKLDIFLKAFANLNLKSSGKIIRIVGDGKEEKKYLKDLVISLNISSSVQFIEGTTDHNLLYDYFKSAYAYVSPGAVGLGVLHSFAYGVPVITMKDPGHGPEFTNVTQGSTGLVAVSFEEYVDNLSQILKNKKYRTMGRAAYKIYSERRQLIHMIDGFINALNSSKKKWK